jgi:hypothetical protein
MIHYLAQLLCLQQNNKQRKFKQSYSHMMNLHFKDITMFKDITPV